MLLACDYDRDYNIEIVLSYPTGSDYRLLSSEINWHRIGKMDIIYASKRSQDDVREHTNKILQVMREYNLLDAVTIYTLGFYENDEIDIVKENPDVKVNTESKYFKMLKHFRVLAFIRKVSTAIRCPDIVLSGGPRELPEGEAGWFCLQAHDYLRSVIDMETVTFKPIENEIVKMCELLGEERNWDFYDSTKFWYQDEW